MFVTHDRCKVNFTVLRSCYPCIKLQDSVPQNFVFSCKVREIGFLKRGKTVVLLDGINSSELSMQNLEDGTWVGF